jgi:Ca2+/Na+ antiporter
MKYTIVQPGTEPDRSIGADERSVEELEGAIARSDDKERAIGLVAAPLAAIVGIVVGSATIDHAKSIHQSVTIYNELTYLLLGLSVLILVTSLLRKRMFQGMTMALYGLAVFNLRFWGFGVPFVMAGAWYLVRSYRLQQALKRAEADAPSQPRRNGTRPANGSRPRSNKRYTPPT